MSEWNERNWLNTLVNVFDKAEHDPDYRRLCLTDPRAAIAEVSDIEVPPDANISFVENKQDLIYTYLLPPAVQPAETREDSTRKLIQWATTCTIFPTTDM